jgi:hypothetical protein
MELSSGQSVDYGLWMAGYDCQVRPRSTIWAPSALLPILQCASIERKAPRELSPAKAGTHPHSFHIQVE